MSISTVVTRGFTTGSFTTEVKFLVTAGYDIGEKPSDPTQTFKGIKKESEEFSGSKKPSVKPIGIKVFESFIGTKYQELSFSGAKLDITFNGVKIELDDYIGARKSPTFKGERK